MILDRRRGFPAKNLLYLNLLFACYPSKKRVVIGYPLVPLRKSNYDISNSVTYFDRDEIMGTRGGRREGSGPKKSMSPYGEKTSVIRVPTSLMSDVLVYLEPFRKTTK